MTGPCVAQDEIQPLTPDAELFRSAWLLSLSSVLWTVLASSAAVVIGVISGSGVLVAFGAIGFVDAIGSATLVYHFGHARRHARASAGLEVIAHRIVVVGLIAVGVATVAVDVGRLVLGTGGEASLPAVGLAAVSLLALTMLSIRKRSVARCVSSKALRADGHLSAVGAAMAAITLAATALTRLFGWRWADATAAIIVGAIAVLLGVQSARQTDG